MGWLSGNSPYYKTDMYAAAWAGAPVANMTSAYGGIRWGSGMNRQFQYEKSQSRIGEVSMGSKDLYIENSPLFHFDKSKYTCSGNGQ